MASPIASAIVLPDQDEERSNGSPAASAGQKRRQSIVEDADSKRQRLNSIDANTHPERRESTISRGDAAPTVKRERGRERRLFGAALGALSQNTGGAVQKKRTEIERRQKAQRAVQEQESDQRKAERTAQRKVQRRIEQRRFERQSMHIRHENLRHTAHFLQTASEPRLYYKPWETTDQEDDRIEDQIADVEESIRRDIEEYEAREHAEDERQQSRSRPAGSGQDADISHTGKIAAATASHENDPANGATDDSAILPKDPDHKEDNAEGTVDAEMSDAHATDIAPPGDPGSIQGLTGDAEERDLNDDNGEEVVEATEDTVIY